MHCEFYRTIKNTLISNVRSIRVLEPFGFLAPLTKKDGREALGSAVGPESSSSSGQCMGSGLVYFSKIRLARLNHSTMA